MQERQRGIPQPPPIVINSGPPQRIETRQRKSRRWMGYVIAVLGLVGFIGIIAASVAMKLEGEAARYAAQGSLLFMGLAFWVGTIVVAIEKGYHALVGIALGAISPLGLLVLTLMPDLAQKRAQIQESQDIGKRVQRTPDYPGS